LTITLQFFHLAEQLGIRLPAIEQGDFVSAGAGSVHKMTSEKARAPNDQYFHFSSS